MQIVLIGDIGGHEDVFEQALTAGGVDVANRQISEDTIVVQVGDLVHKGPDSDACVALADTLMATGRYIQLWGNHDAHYIGGPDVSTRPGFAEVSAGTQKTLLRWRDTGAAQLAVAVGTSMYGQVLVTHAGLTVGMWEQLGSPVSAGVAAEAINALLEYPERAFRPGWLMTGEYTDDAGVTGARTGKELAGPWLSRGQMPFTQIHGHEGVWWWPADDFHSDCPPAVKAASVVERDDRWCWVNIAGKRLWSIDWVLGGVAPSRRWQPLTLDGWVLTARTCGIPKTGDIAASGLADPASSAPSGQ